MRAMTSRIVRWVRWPEVTTDLLQILKSVIAATAAWWLSAAILDSPMPFLSPWTALLTVHATVDRSLSRGVQTTVASAAGTVVAFLIGEYIGVGVWTFAFALFIGLAGARVSWLRDEGTAIATTAIFILGSGFSSQAPLLGYRLMEVGIGVGVIVNLVLLPPLRDRQASRFIDSINRRMGGVLESMADELDNGWDTDRADAWVDDTVSMNDELQSAWQSVRFARESARWNPRSYLPTPRGPRGWRYQHMAAGREVGYEEILTRVGEGISHLRHLARTLREATYSDSGWDQEFRDEWVSIVRSAGDAIADPDADVSAIYDRLDRLAAHRVSDAREAGTLWPIYGSLITSVSHVVLIVDDVVSARESRQPPADAASR